MTDALALDLKERGCLPGDSVVGTVMRNLRLVRAMEAAKRDTADEPGTWKAAYEEIFH